MGRWLQVSILLASVIATGPADAKKAGEAGESKIDIENFSFTYEGTIA